MTRLRPSRSRPVLALLFAATLIGASSCTPATVVVVAAPAAAAAAPGIGTFMAIFLVLFALDESCGGHGSSGATNVQRVSHQSMQHRASPPRRSSSTTQRPAERATTYTSSGQSVSVRSAPQLASRRKALLPAGQQVAILSATCDHASGYVMAHVNYSGARPVGSGQSSGTGWIVRYLLSPRPSVADRCCAGRRFVEGVGCER